MQGKRCHPDPRREGDDALSGLVTAQADLPVQLQESLYARGKVVPRGEIVVEFGLELFARVLVEGQGPFQAADGIEGGSREAILEGVRLEVGQQAVGSGAVMVRELLHRRDAAAAEAGAPETMAAEGMLISYVDPACAAPA